jgi:hypothetical protein
MAEQDEALKRAGLLMGYLAVVLLVGASFMWAVETLDGIVGGQISEDGRRSLDSGRSAANFAFAIIFNGVIWLRQGKGAYAPIVPAKIDPAGNRVLQGVWRETGYVVPAWVGWLAGAALVALVVWLEVLDALTIFTRGGDRAIGYLAGVGSVFVVAIPYLTVGFAIAKLGPAAFALFRRHLTPAPAP